MSRFLTVLAAVGASLAWACGGRAAEESCAKGDRECLNNQYYNNCEEIEARINAASHRPNLSQTWGDQVFENPPEDLEELKRIVESGQCTTITYWTSPVDNMQRCQSTITYQLDDRTTLGIQILNSTETEAEACNYIPYY
ncbi:MAG: hypothetical protein HYT77_08705 [Deltaproteobacteria bacterium]|nr:hypothetical protein [Deltaproteobacteria bacterium]